MANAHMSLAVWMLKKVKKNKTEILVRMSLLNAFCSHDVLIRVFGNLRKPSGANAWLLFAVLMMEEKKKKKTGNLRRS